MRSTSVGSAENGGVIPMDNYTAPTHITATCVECDAHSQTFKLTDADTDRVEAYYDCQECGHTITLTLCP